MAKILKKYKITIIVVIVDLFLFWLLFYSGIVLPFINPCIEDYMKLDTSFPRNYTQVLLWCLLHMPTSIIIGNILKSNAYLSLSVIQTGLIAYLIERHIKRKLKF